MTMPVPFNADEILEIAEQIERNGAGFYRAAAKNFPAISRMLLDLAAMEDAHLKTFAELRSRLSGSEKEELVFDPDNEAQMYLRAMADGYVFDIRSDPAQKLAGVKTVQEVLQMAIGLEKDSIAFYVGLKESVSHRAGKDKVKAIIREEMSHITTLSQRLSGLK